MKKEEKRDEYHFFKLIEKKIIILFFPLLNLITGVIYYMTIKYVLIASPDKVSLGSFTRFLKNSLGNEYNLGETHSLMSLESVNLYIEDFTKKYSKGIFYYFAKRVINKKDPLSFLPERLKETVDTIIWFDLYSTEAMVLKDKDDNMKVIIEDWNKYIEKINV